MTGRASAGGRFRCQNKKKDRAGPTFCRPPYPLWWLLLLYHGDVLTDGADVVWGIGGDAGVVGLSGAEVCHPEGSVLPVGGIGGTGIELQTVLLPLGDVGGGTGHGRPGQWRNGKICTLHKK